MKSRGIIFPEANRAELIWQEVKAPEAGEVLVKTVCSTISAGTERANLIGEVNVGIGKMPEKPVFPRQAGYSTSGIVEAVGEGVTSVKPGDRVAMCWTHHSEYNCIPEKQVSLLPEGVSFEDAAIAHIGTFPLAAVRKCHLEIGEPAMVMGLGILGMLAVQLLHAAGAAPVIAVDPVAEKREYALRYGADFALDPREADFPETVKQLTGGGAHVAIEVTGLGKGLDQALDCMAPMGRVALLGCTRHSDFTIDYYKKVHGPGIVLYGAHTLARPKTESSRGLWTDADDRNALLKLHALGRISLAPPVREFHTPEEAPEIYQRLITEKNFPVVQFDWRKLKKEN